MSGMSGSTEVDVIHCKVGYLPGTIHEIVLDDEATVRAALAAAGLDATGREIRVGGRVAGLDTELEDGDEVFLMKPMKGN